MITYFLDNGTDVMELTTIGKSGLKLSFVRDNAQKFLRGKLTGSLNLTGELHEFALRTLDSCCGSLNLVVYKNGALLVKSKIIPFNVEFNRTLCSIAVGNFTAVDSYSVVMQHWDKEVNLLFVDEIIEFTSPTLLASPFTAGIATQRRGRFFIRMLDYLLRITFLNTSGASLARPNGNGYSQFYEADKNPVTGLENPLKNAAFTHLSDVVEPNASNVATNGPITLKALLEQLRIRHNVFWDIDENGYFRLEHRQFYDLGGSYTVPDLNALQDFSRYGTPSTYKYIKDDMYTSEQIENTLNDGLQKNRKHAPGVNDSAWPDWILGGVRYENCIPTDDDGESKTLTNVDTWVSDYNLAVIDNGESVNRQGWVFVELEQLNGSWSIRRTKGKKSGANLVNGGQSPANLFVAYHRWGRAFSSGIVNEKSFGQGGNRIAMRFVNPNKQWGPFTVAETDLTEFRFAKPVKVGFSEDMAYVQAVEWDLEKGLLSFTVRTGGLCYQNPALWPDIEEDLANPCPPPGELVSTRREIRFEGGGLFRPSIPYMYIYDTFTDGNCGFTVVVTRIAPS